MSLLFTAASAAEIALPVTGLVAALPEGSSAQAAVSDAGALQDAVTVPGLEELRVAIVPTCAAAIAEERGRAHTSEDAAAEALSGGPGVAWKAKLEDFETPNRYHVCWTAPVGDVSVFGVLAGKSTIRVEEHVFMAVATAVRRASTDGMRPTAAPGTSYPLTVSGLWVTVPEGGAWWITAGQVEGNAFDSLVAFDGATQVRLYLRQEACAEGAKDWTAEPPLWLPASWHRKVHAAPSPVVACHDLAGGASIFAEVWAAPGGDGRLRELLLAVGLAAKAGRSAAPTRAVTLLGESGEITVPEGPALWTVLPLSPSERLTSSGGLGFVRMWHLRRVRPLVPVVQVDVIRTAGGCGSFAPQSEGWKAAPGATWAPDTWSAASVARDPSVGRACFSTEGGRTYMVGFGANAPLSASDAADLRALMEAVAAP